MYPVIDKEKTAKRIKRFMELRNISVKDVQEFLELSCVQSVYHWLDGSSLPSIDNLYALSQLLNVPMDDLICGNRAEINSNIIWMDRYIFDIARQKRLQAYYKKARCFSA